MLDVPPISSANTQGASSTATSKKAQADYDAFLQLLVAQMKNQDPTKPMESTEYIAQLASFSNVEQTIQMNEKLDQMLSTSFISNAGSLIGKTITSADGAIQGQVSHVKVSGGQGIAVLEFGQQIAVDSSVTISE